MRGIFKKYFVAGALVLVPIAVTVWVLKTIILWCEGIFETLVPVSWQPPGLLGYELPGIGLVFTLLLVLLVGALTRLYLGRKILSVGDWIIHKIPLGRGIYSSMKQLLNAFMVTGEKNFHRVVLVTFPMEGSQMIGFVTQENIAEKKLHVFVPTTPNPTSGFLLVVSTDKVRPLNLSVEQAFKLIVSGGTTHS